MIKFSWWAVVAAITLSVGQAQVVDAFIGTKGDFLKSSFCTQLAVCVPAGTIQLVGDGSSEEYYSVKPKQKQGFGRSAYTVFFTRESTGVIDRAGVRYPPAQDYVEDGSFARDFFSFAGGMPLQALDGIKLQSTCYWSIRGKSKYFSLLTNNALSRGGIGEGLLIMVELPFGERIFDKLSVSARVIPEECSYP